MSDLELGGLFRQAQKAGIPLKMVPVFLLVRELIRCNEDCRAAISRRWVEEQFDIDDNFFYRSIQKFIAVGWLKVEPKSKRYIMVRLGDLYPTGDTVKEPVNEPSKLRKSRHDSNNHEPINKPAFEPTGVSRLSSFPAVPSVPLSVLESKLHTGGAAKGAACVISNSKTPPEKPPAPPPTPPPVPTPSIPAQQKPFVWPDSKMEPAKFLVLSCKVHEGVSVDDVDWNKQFFARYMTQANKLLSLMGADVLKAVQFLADEARDLKANRLEFRLCTIVDRAVRSKSKKHVPPPPPPKPKEQLPKPEELEALPGEKTIGERFKDEQAKRRAEKLQAVP